MTTGGGEHDAANPQSILPRSEVPVHGARHRPEPPRAFRRTRFPDGLAGEAIPLCGRIVALADVYDALTTKHVYKPAFSHAKAHRSSDEGMGSQFDPDVVQAYIANEDRFLEIHNRFAVREARESRKLRPVADVSLSC